MQGMEGQQLELKHNPVVPFEDVEFEDEADQFCCDLTGFLSPTGAVAGNNLGLQNLEGNGDINDPSPPTSSLSVHQASSTPHLQPSQPHPSPNVSGGGASEYKSPFALPVPHGGSSEHAFFFSHPATGPQYQAAPCPPRNQALLSFLNHQAQTHCQGQIRPATTGSLHLGTSQALYSHPYQHCTGPFSGPLPSSSSPQAEFHRHRRTASSSGTNLLTHTPVSEACALLQHSSVQHTLVGQGPRTSVSGASEHQPTGSMMYSAGAPSSSNGYGQSGQGQGVPEALDTLQRIGISPAAPSSGTRPDSLPDVNKLLSEIPEELIPHVVEKANRRGKGGRQPAIDPRMDPNIDPKKARRILANRQSAARSKMKQKLLVETLRTRQDVLASQRASSKEELELLRRMCADLQAKNAELEQRLSELVASQNAMQQAQHMQGAAANHLSHTQHGVMGMGMGLNYGNGSCHGSVGINGGAGINGSEGNGHWVVNGQSGMVQQLQPSLLPVPHLGQVMQRQQPRMGMEGMEAASGFVM